VIASGAEVAALGRVLGQAAHGVLPGAAGTALTPVERARAYAEFHQSASDAVAWAEMALALQQSMPLSGRALLAAFAAVLPSGWVTTKSDDRFRAVIDAGLPVARLLLAAEVAHQFDHRRALEGEVKDLRDIASRLLAALAAVRMVGGRYPQRAAERVVIVVGEMMASMPIVKDRVVTHEVPELDRYEAARDAAGYYLREFARVARIDLSRWPWRRQPRDRW
jgi:hypothetical protein